jgi:hypothetical protein
MINSVGGAVIYRQLGTYYTRAPLSWVGKADMFAKCILLFALGV